MKGMEKETSQTKEDRSPWPETSTIAERREEQDKHRAPQAGTVEPEKEQERLFNQDRERFDNQGAKEATAARGDETVDYESMTVPELKELAHKRGVAINHEMRKDEIIAALEKG